MNQLRPYDYQRGNGQNIDYVDNNLKNVTPITSLLQNGNDCRNGSYNCGKCNKSFKTKQKLTHHMDSHDENKKFICDYPDCDRRYRSSTLLKNHKNSHKDASNKSQAINQSKTGQNNAYPHYYSQVQVGGKQIDQNRNFGTSYPNSNINPNPLAMNTSQSMHLDNFAPSYQNSLMNGNNCNPKANLSYTGYEICDMTQYPGQGNNLPYIKTNNNNNTYSNNPTINYPHSSIKNRLPDRNNQQAFLSVPHATNFLNQTNHSGLLDDKDQQQIHHNQPPPSSHHHHLHNNNTNNNLKATYNNPGGIGNMHNFPPTANPLPFHSQQHEMPDPVTVQKQPPMNPNYSPIPNIQYGSSMPDCSFSSYPENEMGSVQSNDLSLQQQNMYQSPNMIYQQNATANEVNYNTQMCPNNGLANIQEFCQNLPPNQSDLLVSKTTYPLHNQIMNSDVDLNFENTNSNHDSDDSQHNLIQGQHQQNGYPQNTQMNPAYPAHVINNNNNNNIIIPSGDCKSQQSLSSGYHTLSDDYVNTSSVSSGEFKCNSISNNNNNNNFLSNGQGYTGSVGYNSANSTNSSLNNANHGNMIASPSTLSSSTYESTNAIDRFDSIINTHTCKMPRPDLDITLEDINEIISRDNISNDFSSSSVASYIYSSSLDQFNMSASYNTNENGSYLTTKDEMLERPNSEPPQECLANNHSMINNDTNTFNNNSGNDHLSGLSSVDEVYETPSERQTPIDSFDACRTSHSSPDNHEHTYNPPKNISNYNNDSPPILRG